MDFFLLFYFGFMTDATSDEHFWSNQINTPRLNTWMGLAYEKVCLYHIDRIKQKLGITGVLTEINSLYCNADPDKGLFGSQTDLIIVRKDNVINLCEMKYSDSAYMITKKTDEDIRRKIHDLQVYTGTKYSIHPTLITPYGLVDNSYSGNIQATVTIDDLF